jgi:hypothetical protein
MFCMFDSSVLVSLLAHIALIYGISVVCDIAFLTPLMGFRRNRRFVVASLIANAGAVIIEVLIVPLVVASIATVAYFNTFDLLFEVMNQLAGFSLQLLLLLLVLLIKGIIKSFIYRKTLVRYALKEWMGAVVTVLVISKAVESLLTLLRVAYFAATS